MSEYYQPPFTMTEEITNLVIEIGEQVGAVVTYDSLKPNPTLRRESRIRSIHSSLAIEQNTLTLEQVRRGEECIRSIRTDVCIGSI